VLGDRPAAGSGPTCDTAGVIAPIVHVVTGLQAAEALKLMAGREDALLPGLATVDLWQGTFDVLDLRGRAPWCPACTEARYDFLRADVAPGAALCGRDAVQIRGAGAVDLAALGERLRAAGPVTANEHLVRLLAPDAELVVFRDGRAIVKGARDVAHARSLYARYVGA
jgi:adenylyltransferase/sulfurtransferase